MSNEARKDGEKAGNEFVEKLVAEVTDSTTEQFVFAVVADKLLDGMITFRIPAAKSIKFLELMIELLKKVPNK